MSTTTAVAAERITRAGALALAALCTGRRALALWYVAVVFFAAAGALVGPEVRALAGGLAAGLATGLAVGLGAGAGAAVKDGSDAMSASSALASAEGSGAAGLASAAGFGFGTGFGGGGAGGGWLASKTSNALKSFEWAADVPAKDN